ncbi:hypothetical protein FE697_012215 [Mumia zhuanghuii]|uniref:PASTA domain-containing protein n=2 Tax=Mumia TaxID=1546255 RepID=A0ABW1QEF4_9ACTN|nr:MULTISPECIES: hypothetical protein [Mumia]KAA1422902.1 hypothetical protein FE697_012215 [Mumia zhuanghuii]
MGASGLAAGIVIALAALVLLVLAVLGMGLLLVGGLSRRRSGRPLVWAGAVMLGIAASAAIGVVVWAGVTGDPDTLELDLREPLTTASLDKEQMPGFPGVYDYASDRVDLVLPDGSRFASDAGTVTVWSDDGLVTSVKINRPMTTRSEAADVIRTWADDLGIEPYAIDETTDRAWSETHTHAGAEVVLSMQPGPDGDARPSLAINLPSAQQ